MVEKAQKLSEDPSSAIELLDLNEQQKKEVEKAKLMGDDPLEAVEKLLDED